MQVIRSVKEMQDKMVNTKNRVGFVPTMGFFHEGHTSLMKQARIENDIVVTSIFVNPLQFGPNEDFEKYPRDEEEDIKQAQHHGVDILFIPDVQAMYPQEMSISIQSKLRTDVLCGRSRPGHFNGVITVLTKLFHIIQPNKVYFGMKDAQQVAVVDGLISDLNFPIELNGMPTIREKNGLAKSSRNVNLRKEEYEEAIWLYKSLSMGKQLVAEGETNPTRIVQEVTRIINQKTNGKIDYVELLSYPTLENISIINQTVILAVAVYFEQTRLIDNLIFNHNGKTIERIN